MSGFVVAAGCVFVGLLAIHVVFLFLPLNVDTGTFLTMASGVLHGKIPYLDLFDHKPPGVYWAFALALKLWASPYSVKILVLTLNVAATAVVFLLGFRLVGKWLGLLAAAFYGVALPVYQGTWGLTRPITALFVTAALLLYLRKGECSRRRVFLVGLLVGVATLFTQTGVLALLSIMLFECVLSIGQLGVYQRTVRGLVLAAGFVVPLTAAGLYFYVAGALPDFLSDVLWANVSLSQSGPNPVLKLAAIYEQVARFPLIWVLGAATAIGAVTAYVRTRVPTAELLLATLLLFCSVPLVSYQWGHYFVELLPSTALLAAYSIRQIWRFFREAGSLVNRERTVAFALALALAAMTLPGFRAIGGEAVSTVFLYNLPKQAQIARQIEETLGSQDNILILDAPEMYYLLGRWPLDRNVYYFTANYAITYDNNSIVSTLQTKDVRFVLANAEGAPTWNYLEPSFEYIKAHYTLVRAFAYPAIGGGQREVFQLFERVR